MRRRLRGRQLAAADLRLCADPDPTGSAAGGRRASDLSIEGVWGVLIGYLLLLGFGPPKKQQQETQVGFQGSVVFL